MVKIWHYKMQILTLMLCSKSIIILITSQIWLIGPVNLSLRLPWCQGNFYKKLGKCLLYVHGKKTLQDKTIIHSIFATKITPFSEVLRFAVPESCFTFVWKAFSVFQKRDLKKLNFKTKYQITFCILAKTSLSTLRVSLRFF